MHYGIALKDGQLDLHVHETLEPAPPYCSLSEAVGKELELFLAIPKVQDMLTMQLKIIQQTRESQTVDLDEMDSAAHWEGMYKREKATAELLNSQIANMQINVRVHQNENAKLAELLEEHGLREMTAEQKERIEIYNRRMEEKKRQEERLGAD